MVPVSVRSENEQGELAATGCRVVLRGPAGRRAEPGRPAAPGLLRDEGAQGVRPVGRGRGARRARRLRATDAALARRAARQRPDPPDVQPRRHQRARTAVPAVRRGCADARAAYPVVPLAKGQAVSASGSRRTTAGSTTASTPTATRCPTSTCSPSASRSRSPSCARRCDERPSSPAAGSSSVRGGVLGAAWMIGALQRARDRRGLRRRASADVIIGTSAGSVSAALLGCRVSVENLLDHQRGRPVGDGPLSDYDLRLRPGDRRGAAAAAHALASARRPLLLRAVRAPARVTPAGRDGWRSLPEGRARCGRSAHLVDAVTPSGEWSPHPHAVDRGDGLRHRPSASPSAATAPRRRASPTRSSRPARSPAGTRRSSIDGRRYVDGGTCSATSVDLLADEDSTRSIVLAPMASFDYDHPAASALPGGAALPPDGDAAHARRGREGATRRGRGDDARPRARGPRGDRRQPHGPVAVASSVLGAPRSGTQRRGAAPRQWTTR